MNRIDFHASVTRVIFLKQGKINRKVITDQQNFYLSDPKKTDFKEICESFVKIFSEYYEGDENIFDDFNRFCFTDGENVYSRSINTGIHFYFLVFIRVPRKGESVHKYKNEDELKK